MSIDWYTVGAQLLNFLILVGLLKHFLYRPILDGIDAREQEIATRMSEAATVKAEAHAKYSEYQQQIAQSQQQHSDTLASSRAAAELERDKILNEGRQRIDADHQAAQHQRRRHAQRFIDELNDQAGKVLLSVTKKAVKDLSDQELEERLVMHALTTLKQNALHQDNTHEGSTHAQVCTREALTEKSQMRLQKSVMEYWPELELSFANNTEQSPGALVQLGSLQVDWTIDTYVSDLAAALSQKLLPAMKTKE